MSDPVFVEKTELAQILWLQRPEVRNALSFRAIEILEEVSAAWQKSPPTAPLVVRGVGGWFASGGDLREFAPLPGEAAARMAGRMQRVLARIADLPVITLAVLDGPAIGGGAELSLACDLRVAQPHAYLHFAQAQLGITTGWQGAERILRLVGYSRAVEILAAAERISADRALDLGLVNAVWRPDEFETRLQGLLLSLNRPAAREMKALLRDAEVGLAGPQREREIFARLWDRPERREAMVRALGDSVDVYPREQDNDIGEGR